MGFVWFKPALYYRPKRNISPLFRLELTSDLGASEKKYFNLNQKPYSKYLPFNFIYVANKSDTDIFLHINDSIKKKINAGTIESFDEEVIPAIRSVAIENTSSTATISKDDIEILIQKQKTYKSVLNKIFENL